MAAFGQNAQSPLSSISSGSQSPKEKRSQEKKEFQQKVNQLAVAISLIPVIDAGTRDLGPKQTTDIRITGLDGSKTYTYTRTEFREFMSLIIHQVKHLPAEAFRVMKTHRETASGSGFDAPQRFNPEMVNFFAQAVLGPQVNGTATQATDKKTGKVKTVPDERTLQVIPNSDLHNALYFTRPQINGQDNPLYGIIPHGIVTPLFALHMHYASGQEVDKTAVNKATPQMRTLLRNTLIATIDKDVENFSIKYPDPQTQQAIRELGQRMKESIDNPNVYYDSHVGVKEQMFNPNGFPFAHFSKIISNGKVRGENQLVKGQLGQLGQMILNVYSTLPEFQNLRMAPAIANNVAATADVILSTQRFSISCARLLKNVDKTRQDKERKQLKKAQDQARVAAENAARQAQILQQTQMMQQQQQYQQQQQFQQGITVPNLPGGPGPLIPQGGQFQTVPLPTAGGNFPQGIPTVGGGLPTIQPYPQQFQQ